tara:strand:- start:301 stop:1236 length:936 start_codon:yes stop_codon:yes gene_type:complete
MHKRIVAILFLIIFFKEPIQSSENFIVLKVNNNVITKIDVDNEYNYLIALNSNLKKLDKEKLYKLSKDSIIREKIKKDEIEKYIGIDNFDNENFETIFKNFYNNLGLNNEKDFEKYLSNYNLSFSDVKQKIFIEISWNNLIYNKFINQIQINKNLIKKQIETKKKQNKSITNYLLSEILFEVNDNENYEDKISEILENIRDIGFEATANIYSIADSAKLGGKLGWIDGDQVSKNIIQDLKILNQGDLTKPISVPGGFLILKLNDKKEIKAKVNFDVKIETQKAIQYQTNKQLDKFSKVYFSRIKKNSFISE